MSAFKNHYGSFSVLADRESPEAMWNVLAGAFHAGEKTLPDKTSAPNKPWISQRTLDIITQRAAARCSGDHVEERRLHKEVRVAARRDRTAWVDALLERNLGCGSKDTPAKAGPAGAAQKY